MAFELIEIATPQDRVRGVVAVAEDLSCNDVQIGPTLDGDRRLIRLLVGEMDRQALLDRLQAVLGKSDDWHIVMLPTDTVIPRETEDDEEDANPEHEEKEEKKKKEEQERASREELYNLVASGARLDSNFLLLVVLSTIVASVGLERDSVAVVIGAMVIAPLLGPNVAFAFATTIGDRKLMLSALRANVVGAAMLLAANVASVNLAAQLVFAAKGIGPRLWHERRSARAAVAVSLATWAVLLAVLVGVVALRETAG